MRKSEFRLLMSTILVTMSFVVAITLAQTSALGAEPIKVKINAPVPPPPTVNPVTQAFQFFVDKLEKNSQGRFKVDIYYGGSLYKDDHTQYSALRKNVVQMIEVSGGRLGGEIPETFLPELPFAFDDMDHVRRFFEGEGFKLYEPLFLKAGYKLVALWQNGFQQFICSKRFLAKPEDFVGIKTRIRPSKLSEQTMEAWGASAQVIPFFDTYTALQLGTVDAAECPMPVIQAVKWHETGNYLTLSRHSLLDMIILANPDWYNGLPGDLKKIFDDTVKETNEFEFKTQQTIDRQMPYIMLSEQPNLKFKWLTDKERAILKKKSEPVWNEYKKRIPQKFFDVLEQARTSK